MTESELRASMIEAMASYIGAVRANDQFNEIINTYNTNLPYAVNKWGTRNLAMNPAWAWCACTVSSAAHKSGNADVVPIEMGVYEMMQIAKKNGVYQARGNGYGWQPADIIIMNWTENGKSNWHTGIIEEVGSNYITTIEGNAGGGNCLRKTLLKSDSKIIGVVSPLYCTKATAPTPAPEPPKTEEPPKDEPKADTLKDLIDTMNVGDTITVVEKDGDIIRIKVTRSETKNI